ncbi:MAG: hypothetical protein HETSPECPRED_004981 [Heterodermia speciosa]|uniref:Amidohydrolase-related domain-containing protein n=1 Tax=Heterodermia speciosa TaxID=116794 RepID=A0A8H3IKF9_9LECA|nr:MAG: hypothetical protein HETSPECPRED_004981 [Heterodermia speciosa]
MIVANHGAPDYGSASHPKIALDNVRVFNGHRILPPSTVIIDGATIGTDARGAKHIDGNGHILLPGFIDTHCHPSTEDDLRQMTSYGITTALLQSGTSPSERAFLMNHHGLTDLRFGSVAAVVADSPSAIPPFLVENYLASPEDARAFVADQSASDWIKVLALVTPDYATITQPILDALVSAARGSGKATIVHASEYDSVHQALLASANQIHHSPIDRPADGALAQLYLAGGQAFCPTLTAMQAIVESSPSAGYNFTAAVESVTALYRGGVPILAGTDATQLPGPPFQVPFGNSMHLELELLVKAGMKELDALRAATVLPARYYGLHDRGRVEVGMRTDLVLVGCDPTKNIGCTRDIKRIWVAGVEFVAHESPALTTNGWKEEL